MINLFLGFEGRISRQPFWLGFLLLTAVEVAVLLAFGVPFFANQMKPFSIRLIEFVVELVVTFPAAALLVKRLHDRNQPGSYAAWLIGLSLLGQSLDLVGLTGDPNNVGWLEWILGFFAILIVLAFLVELGFRRGTAGDNRYGPDPLGGYA